MFHSIFLPILVLFAQIVVVDGKYPQLPSVLGTNGGLKVECWNGSAFGNCVGSGGGGGGTVDQGTGGISPWLINFNGAQPVTQSGTWTFSFTSPQAITQSGTWTVGINNFPTAANTDALAVRCVNAAGNAFESCAGSGGAGSDVNITGVGGNAVTTTVPISGTVAVSNFPASQVVTGPLTDAQLRASAVPVSLTSTTITNFPATQPVSGTVTANVGTVPTLTKGTQGATGYTVQNLKDAGRSTVSLSLLATAPTTADTASAALIKTTNGVAAGGTTSITATAGKTLHMMSFTASIRTTTAATPWALVTVRMSTTTTCAVSSPVVAYLAVGGTAAVSGNTGQTTLSLGDGFQLLSGGSFCISISGNVTTNTLTFSAQGFEY